MEQIQRFTVKLKNYGYEILILILLGLMYFNSGKLWVKEWLNFDSFYSYGLFMPLFCFFYFKANLGKLKITPKKPSKLGIPLLILGILFYVIGMRVEYRILADLSLVVLLSGGILLLWGWRIFSLCLFPLVILTMSLPILPIIRITTQLQLFFSKSTTIFLNMLGVNAKNVGSVVYMDNYAVSIEPGCTGLKSLLNLTAISLMYSYFIKASLLKKSLFIASSFPITFINNMLRISISGFYVIFNGYGGFESFHYTLGLVFYVIGLSVLMFISKLIEDVEYE